MNFAFEVVRTIREEEPELFDEDLSVRIVEMIEEAIEVESQFAEDVLSGGVAGMSTADTRPIWSSWQTNDWLNSDYPNAMAPKIPLTSWNCKTYKS